MNHRTLLCTSIALLIALTACASKEPPMIHAEKRASGPTVADSAVAESDARAPLPPGQEPKARRMVIREAHVELRSEKPGALGARITQLAEGSGGFVVSSDANGVGDAVTRVNITVRVPSNQFEPTLVQLRGFGELLREQVTGKDVTEEYVDLEARLRTKRQMEERLLEILQRASTVEDTLKVEQELGRVRTDIEQILGRKNYLEDRVNLSTIHITASAPYQPTASEAESFGSQISAAFSDSVDLFIGVIGGLIRVIGALLPIVVVVSVMIWGSVKVWRWTRRRRG